LTVINSRGSGWRIYSSDIPPRSGPAPKVHWSM
jgi:hypothetical protein